MLGKDCNHTLEERGICSDEGVTVGGFLGLYCRRSLHGIPLAFFYVSGDHFFVVATLINCSSMPIEKIRIRNRFSFL